MSKNKKSPKSKVQSPKPDLVIQFVGKKSDPPTRIINGGKTIELPDPEEQRKGFTHADSKFLLKHYRKFYKPKVRKGKKK